MSAVIQSALTTYFSRMKSNYATSVLSELSHDDYEVNELIQFGFQSGFEDACLTGTIIEV